LWPDVEKEYIDSTLEAEMTMAQELSTAINSFRKENSIKVKIPLKKLTYNGVKLSEEVLAVVKSETNTEELTFEAEKETFEIVGDPSEKNQNIEAGQARDIIRNIQKKRKELATTMTQMVEVGLPAWPKPYEDEIKRKALVSKLYVADEFEVKIP
jgi:valyl-tRNA synthetase